MIVPQIFDKVFILLQKYQIKIKGIFNNRSNILKINLKIGNYFIFWGLLITVNTLDNVLCCVYKWIKILLLNVYIFIYIYAYIYLFLHSKRKKNEYCVWICLLRKIYCNNLKCSKIKFFLVCGLNLQFIEVAHALQKRLSNRTN